MTAIALEPLDVARHLELVHGWMQQPHVVPWWQLDGASARTRDHLLAQRALAPREPWIATADGTPFAYVETYRAAEDPLAAHYEARPGDRGWHLLVGPPAWLGTGVARLLGNRVVDGLLAEPGCERVVCEPDVRNARMIAFCERLGGRVVAELELPDKRAALVVWERVGAPTAGAGA